MATDTHVDETHDAEHGASTGGLDIDSHDKKYWLIALILAVITAVEVTTYTHEDAWKGISDTAPIWGLYFMMGVKFFMITWWFMHLNSDWAKGPGGKLLTWIFYLALALAIAVYLVTLGAFRVLPL